MNNAKRFQIKARATRGDSQAGHAYLSNTTLKIPNLNQHLPPFTTMKLITRFRPTAVAVLLMVLALAGPVSAATLTWTNTAGGDWASATNWSPNAIPGSGDTAVINASGTYAVRVDGSRTVGTVVMANPNAILLLKGSGSTGQALLTVANGFVNEGTIELSSEGGGFEARLTVSSGTLTNATGGVLRAVEGNGGPRTLTANLDNRGTLEVARDLTLNGNVANSGTVNLAAGKTLTVSPAATWTHRASAITGTGTLSLANNSTFVLEEDFTPGGFVLNAPNLTVNGPGKLLGPTTGEFLIRNWTINAGVVVTGDLRVDGVVRFNSGLAVSAGKTLRVTGSSQTGQSLLTVSNGVVNQGIIELSSEGGGFEARLTVSSGTLTNATGGVLRAVEGNGGPRTLTANLDNRGTLEVARDLTLNGNVANSGTVNLAAGKTLTVSPAATWTHRASAITGTGTLSLANNSTFVLEEDFTPGGFVLNAPNLTVNGPGKLLGPTTGEFLIRNWTINAGVVVTGDLRVDGVVRFNSGLAVSAGKTLRVTGSSQTGQSLLTVSNGVVNQGIIELSSEGGGFEARLTVSSGTLTNATGGVLRAVEGNGGPRTLTANLDNRGTLLVESNTTLSASGTLLNATTGILAGAGTFNLASATVTNLGTVAPGVSPGILTISGNLPWNSGARFDVEMNGFTAGTNYDRLVLSSPVSLNGIIRAELINGFFPKKDDAFTVLTYPSRTGSFTTLDNPLPDRIAWEVQYGPTSAQLVVLNTAPTLAAITNQTVNEQTQLSVTASATDQDLPAQTMTYSLDTAPPGMTINPASGQITWTPTEAQGPDEYAVTVRVVDNGTPVLGHTNSFTVTVKEVNVAPQFALPGAQSVNEQVELGFTVNATDADLPVNALTYEMLSAPPGATFNATTREFRWTPTEGQRPGDFTVTFRVTDNNPDAVNLQQLSATGSVSIAVNEINRVPLLTVPGNRTVDEGTLFSATATATDADLPANLLTFSLVSPPTGMTINPASGAISWTPTEAQGPFTNTITVVVTDTNPPAANAKQLSATNTFQLTVHEANNPPALPVQTNRTISELTLLTVTNTATDSDLPTNGLSYALTVFPTGATISTNGIITWTPTEGQGPATNIFTTVVTDTNLAAVGAQNLTATNTFTVFVNEVNTSPTLPVQTNRTITELTLLTVNNAASDSDSPANGLGYTLTAFPPGATISSSGVITWTPTEAQGPSTNVFTTVVTDTNLAAVNAQNLTATNTFTVFVNESNAAPVLTLPPSVAISELVPYANSVAATDADLPANPLVFELISGPSGLNMSAGGAITWTPTEAQGPGVHPVQVKVTDTNPFAANATSLSVTGSFTLTVNEVNLAPVLAIVPDATVHAGTSFSTTLSATDPDLPANTLSYSLISGPTGATVSPVGAVQWTVPLSATGTSAGFTVRVTDTGGPAASADRSFQVSVTGVLEILSSVRNGEQLEIIWRAIPGGSYRLLQSGSLPAAQWTAVPGVVEAAGVTATKSIAIEAMSGGSFFKVELIDD